MVFSSETLRPGYAPAAAIACLQLFCISLVRCIEGMNGVCVWWSRGALLVSLGQLLAAQREEGSFSPPQIVIFRPSSQCDKTGKLLFYPKICDILST
jgi:hypothetical protein